MRRQQLKDGRSLPWTDIFGQRADAGILQFADHCPPGPALDLGAGEGRNARALAAGYEVLAVDTSAEALAECRRRARQAGLALQTRQARIEDLRPARQSLHWISAAWVLMHLPPDRIRPCLRRWYEALIDGGILHLVVFSVDDPSCRRDRLIHGRPRARIFPRGETGSFRYFTRAELLHPLSGMEILHQAGGMSRDPGHGHHPEPHDHGWLEIVARRPLA